MKKHYLAILFLFAAVSTWAQVPFRSLDWNQTLKAPIKGSAEQARKDYQQHCKNSTERTVQTWLSYGLDVDGPNLNNGTAVFSGNYLFPDSNVNVNFTDAYGNPVEGSPYIHMLADVLDPVSVVFNIADGVNMTTSTEYDIDSAAVYLAYDRHTDASIVDTLIIYLFEGAVPNNATSSDNLPEYGFYSQPGFDVLANYGVDTIWMPFNKYKYSTNKPNATPLTTLKFPLTESDSSAYYYFKFFSTGGFHVPAGHKASMVMAFKPGYTYNPFDNIADNYNTVFFGSYQEFANGYQTYYQDEWNVSSVLPTFVRYNMDANWNGLFIPSYAWIDPYPWQHHIFAYQISYNPTGINEPNQVLSNIQITPNPSTDYAQVNFSLNNSSDVSIELYDITGRLINSFSAGKLSKGNHYQQINVSDLAAGVYTVSVVSGNEKATQKLMVGK